jgi:DNA (cytosine-5)-methyltransferase 1
VKPLAYYNEIDPNAAGWLRNLIDAGLIAPGVVDERSITEVRPDDLEVFAQVHLFAGIGGFSLALRLAGWPDDRPVWTGSCPCQGFSSAGNRKGKEDARHLWPAMFGLVRQCRPPVLLSEQVEDAIRHGWLDDVFADLEGEHYACGAAVLPASGVKAPHARPRLYIVADAAGERQPQPRQRRENARDNPADAFGEADRLVDAFRRRALPFLCRGHDGLPRRLGRIAGKALGNAIVPQVAAEFIRAYLDVAEMEPA